MCVRQCVPLLLEVIGCSELTQQGFPRLVTRPEPRIIMALCVCVCVCVVRVYFSKTFCSCLHSPHIPAPALFLKPVVPSVSSLSLCVCVCVCVCMCVCVSVHIFREGEYIMQIREDDWGKKKKAEGGCGNGNDSVSVCVCVCVCV